MSVTAKLIQHALIYRALLTHASGRTAADCQVSAVFIWEVLGQLCTLPEVVSGLNLLVHAGVACTCTPGKGAANTLYSIPQLRTINDYELQLRAILDTIKQVIHEQ